MMNSQVVFPKTSSLVVFPSPKAAELSLGICSKGHVTQHLPGSPPRRRHLVDGEKPGDFPGGKHTSDGDFP